MNWSVTKTFSPGQFALFRVLFGLYLVQHFLFLIPDGAELFSDQGVLADASLNPTHGILPNPLEWWGSPTFVTAFIAGLALLSFLLVAGVCRRLVVLLIWFGWACLFNRNNLISNPSIPYVGLLLVLLALVPDGEPWRFKGKSVPPKDWSMPAIVYWGAWLLMAGGYTFSGLVKLGSPSWIDGTAFLHLIDNPLARPGPVRELFLKFPGWVHALLTWSVLAAEIVFLPASFWRRGRCAAWTVMVAMHLGILLMVDFADLSFGMLMIHLFTFDPRWLPGKRDERAPVLLYDGDCGLCNAVVRFLLREDVGARVRFAPLQSQLGQEFLRLRGLNTSDFDSMVFVSDWGNRGRSAYFLRTTGALRVCAELGGLWRVLSWIKVVPRPIRDAGYKLVARTRYAAFGEYRPTPLPDPEWSKRFL